MRREQYLCVSTFNRYDTKIRRITSFDARLLLMTPAFFFVPFKKLLKFYYFVDGAAGRPLRTRISVERARERERGRSGFWRVRVSRTSVSAIVPICRFDDGEI